jgi:hypothetical protein
MYASQLATLYKVAAEIGSDVHNPEGGLSMETSDEDIIEVIVDVANGAPHKLDVDPDLLTERQRERVLECFMEAVHKAQKAQRDGG